jgi:hypothetical protein
MNRQFKKAQNKYKIEKYKIDVSNLEDDYAKTL